MTTRKTNGRVAYFPSNKVKLIKIFNIFVIFLDIYISNFVFVFNSDRTFSTGLYQVLWVQFPIILILLVTNRLEYKLTTSDIKQQAGITQTTKRKVPLFHQKSDEQLSSSTSFTGSEIIFFLLFSDILFTSILLFYGFFFAPIFLFATIAYQAYFLVPAFIIYLYYNRNRLIQDFEKFSEVQFEQRSLIQKIRKLSKFRKYFVTACLIFLFLGIGLVWSAKVTEDYHTQIVNPREHTPYANAVIHHIEQDNQITKLVATTTILNEFDTPFPQLSFLEINSGKVINHQEILPLERQDESVVDSMLYGDTFYIMIENDLEYWFKIYEIDPLNGASNEVAHFDLNEFLFVNYEQHFAVSSDQYFLISSPYLLFLGRPFLEDNYGEYSYVLSTDPDNSTVVIESTINAVVYESYVYQDQLFLLHRPLDQDTYFESNNLSLPLSQTSYNSSAEVMYTPYPENPEGSILPYGATLFTIENELYYRSANNFYSPSREVGIDFTPGINIASYRFGVNQFPGYASINNRIVLNSHELVLFINTETLELDQEIHARNSQYLASPTANLFHHNNELISASIDGRIYYWPHDSAEISRHSYLINGTIILSVITYFAGVLGLLSRWEDLGKLEINITTHN